MDWIVFFSMFLREKEIFFEAISLIDETMFDNAIMSNLFILIRKFAEKYKKQPTIDTLYLLLERLPDVEREHKQQYVEIIEKIGKANIQIDIDVFKDELYKAIRGYEVEKFILKTANSVKNIDFDNLLEDIRLIVRKFQPKSMGVDVSQSDRVMQLIKHDRFEKISTGLESLDKVLYGGFGVNELTIVIAPPGRGKSFFLQNLLYGAMLSQKNGLYLTFELSERTVLKRLYSRISYSSRREMTDEAQVVKAVNKFFTLTKTKSRVMYYPSNTISVEGLESVIEQQQMYFDFVPEILIVDYLDLLAPRRSDMRLEYRHRLRNITDDLRSISLRRNIPVLSATQANRASLAKVKITEANVSEAFGKIEVADIVLAFCQTDEEKQMKRARVVVLKNRDYISGSCVEVYVDFERMILMDLSLAEKMGLLVVKSEQITIKSE